MENSAQYSKDNIKIVLMETSHPGNIGSTARAMKNMGFFHLVLVNPKKFPDREANALAAGADDVLANAKVVDSLAEAIEDCEFVTMTTARQRESKWLFSQSRDAAQLIHTRSQQQTIALVFGPERTGLSNQDLDKSHLLIHIPTSPFSSLNLAMAVNLMCYEIHMSGLIANNHEDAPQNKPASLKDVPSDTKTSANHTDSSNELFQQDNQQTIHQANLQATPIATQGDVEQFYQHYYEFLDSIDFFRGKPTTKLMRKIRHIYQRSLLTKDEIHLLRGMFSRATYQLSKNNPSKDNSGKDNSDNDNTGKTDD